MPKDVAGVHACDESARCIAFFDTPPLMLNFHPLRGLSHRRSMNLTVAAAAQPKRQVTVPPALEQMLRSRARWSAARAASGAGTPR